MAYKQTGYQYETSPKKLKPEYEPTKSKKTQKKAIETKKKQEKSTSTNIKPKSNIKAHVKAISYILVGFALLFAISYRNSLITESFNEKEDLKKKLGVLQKENAQLEINIQSTLNLANIQKNASEMLGMQKIDESQKVYVTLPKKDYVEPATEHIKTEETKRWYEKLLDSIMSLIQ